VLHDKDYTRDLLHVKDYTRAFHRAVARMCSCEGDTGAPVKHLVADAVDYVCLLSQDGDVCSNTGRIRDLNQGDDDSNARKMCPPKGKEDWSALAGQQEVVLLRALGFDTTQILNGQELDDKGIANSYVMQQFWGFHYYSQLLGSDGGSVLAAASALAAQRTTGVNSLAKSPEFRKEDMKWDARNRRCRGICLTASNCQNCRSRVNHEFTFRLLGEIKDAILAIKDGMLAIIPANHNSNSLGCVFESNNNDNQQALATIRHTAWTSKASKRTGSCTWI